jgi:hypothetical protein
MRALWPDATASEFLPSGVALPGYHLLTQVRWPDLTAGEFLLNVRLFLNYCLLTRARWPDTTAGELFPDSALNLLPFANPFLVI